jgi:crotonobetainyl-CoA:carnitine CoA-transferase CaiB-like acyl-CoA transferase
VLDLGVIVMGAELSRLLADMGADVVKVENLAFPDGMRWLSPGGVLTAAIAWGHRNKRGLGLNLRDPRGVQMFLQLVGEADMVLSNFKPGTMEQLGLSYDVLSKANPRIVVGECSALGADGEWSTRMGYGPLVRAACGLTALWAYPERDDGFCDSGTIYPDHAAARAQAVGVLSALLRARRTGAGALVKAAQSETILSELSTELLRESLEPGSVRALGNPGEFDAPQGVYPAAGDDEWVVVEVSGDQQWRALAAVLGLPDLIGDPRFASAEARLAHRRQIDDLVWAWTCRRSPWHAMEVLQHAGVPAAGMRRIVDLLDDPQMAAREHYAQLLQPQLGAVIPAERSPARYARIADPPQRPAPLAAQHTRSVAADWLGLTEAQIDAAIEAGILELATRTD